MTTIRRGGLAGLRRRPLARGTFAAVPLPALRPRGTCVRAAPRLPTARVFASASLDARTEELHFASEVCHARGDRHAPVRSRAALSGGSTRALQAFRAKALCGSREQYDAMYKRSVEDPAGFWGDIAKEFHW